MDVVDDVILALDLIVIESRLYSMHGLDRSIEVRNLGNIY